jgi:hypothetical protein
MVFDAAGDNMPAFVGSRPYGPKNRRVVGFRAATSENDLAFLCTKELRHAHTRIIDRSARLSSEYMDAAGIAEMVA